MPLKQRPRNFLASNSSLPDNTRFTVTLTTLTGKLARMATIILFALSNVRKVLLGARASSREAKRERESELFARDGPQAFR